MANFALDDPNDLERPDSDVEMLSVESRQGEIIKLLELDSEFFIEFFLGDQLDMPVPAFHQEIWQLMSSTAMERILLAIPRDHAKTTLAKLNVVWHWLFTQHRFTVYLSNTAPIAKGACKDIINYLKTPNFEAVFGTIKMIKESETEGLWQFDMPMGNGKTKHCILRAIGQAQQMRGINIDNQRPDLAVVDDVEDNDNTATEFLQKKLDRWMFGPFLKALARKKKIIWLGNMLSKTSLLARLSRSPKWNPVVFGALVKNVVTGTLTPLWPEKWTVAQLQEDLEEYRTMGLIETWYCEMMNLPGHTENGFTADQFHYQVVPTPDSIKAAWITLDPAFGMKDHNDNTAIVVHALPNNSDAPMVVSHVHCKMDEVTIFNEMLRLAFYWNAWVWGIEAVAAQKVLLTLFKTLAASRMMQGRIEMIPLLAGKGDPKAGRISAWVALMAKKEYAIPEYDIEITTQLLNYDLSKKDQKDDLIDGCAYGPAMMERYLPLLISKFNEKSTNQPRAQFGRRVAGV